MRTIDSISPQTKLCGIIGNPVEHSMSPALHNHAFGLLKLDYVYLAFRVESGQVGRVLDGVRAMENFRGLSVTIPHKIEVIECLDTISEVDKAIGSVNTIINNNGTLHGLGSDGPGARQALIENSISPANRTVTIVGSGGAARAIAFDLVAHATPAKLFLCGVVEEELNQLATNVSDITDIQVIPIMIDASRLHSAISASQVLINASPVGMYPHVSNSPVSADMLHSDLGVMDIVYNPLNTKLLTDAKAAGLKTVSGVEMFVNQAVIQFESWTQKAAPRLEMRKIVMEKLSR